MNLYLLDYLRAPLSRREWVYLLSLLVPFVAYDLALKASSVTSVPGLALTFDLMRSDVFFNLGYALFWIGLFAAVRDSRGSLRRVVVVLFHLSTILVVVTTTTSISRTPALRSTTASSPCGYSTSIKSCQS